MFSSAGRRWWVLIEPAASVDEQALMGKWTTAAAVVVMGLAVDLVAEEKEKRGDWKTVEETIVAKGVWRWLASLGS